jgi:hypothetical protein
LLFQLFRRGGVRERDAQFLEYARFQHHVTKLLEGEPLVAARWLPAKPLAAAYRGVGAPRAYSAASETGLRPG